MLNWQGRTMKSTYGESEINDQGMTVRDVIYWYLDYREFANVVKYRLAMMRRAIDQRIKQVLLLLLLLHFVFLTADGADIRGS